MAEQLVVVKVEKMVEQLVSNSAAWKVDHSVFQSVGKLVVGKVGQWVVYWAERKVLQLITENLPNLS